MRQRVHDSGRDDAEETRRRLIAVSTTVFAERGFSEARIRDIATRAGVNVAMIGYHFANKEGLYGAVIADIGAKMAAPIAATIEEARQTLASPAGSAIDWNVVVGDLLVALYRVMLEDGVEEWSRIMLREQMDPSPFFIRLHADVAEPFISTLAAVLERRAADAGALEDQPSAMIKAVMLMGQLLVFTSAKSSIKQMIAPSDMARIEIVIRHISLQ